MMWLSRLEREELSRERLDSAQEGARSMGVLGAVVSLKGGMTSGTVEWYSGKWSVGMSCRPSWVVLMRWDTCRDLGADKNLITTNVPSAFSFSKYLERVGEWTGLSFDLKSHGILCTLSFLKCARTVNKLMIKILTSWWMRLCGRDGWCLADSTWRKIRDMNRPLRI